MSISKNLKAFIPVSKSDLSKLGRDKCDFIIVTGDAYVDHPSFGAAVIARLLEAEGFSIGIIAQPDWTDAEAFKVLGRPEYAFLITSGNLDSMVNHYSSTKKPRRTDAYSPGGRCGLRPDRALIAYTSAARSAYKGVAVILGGIEASLRRLSHYDYWSDKLRRSVLADSKADLLIYGMGERPVIEAAHRLAAGEDIKSLCDIRGTAYRLGGKMAEAALLKAAVSKAAEKTASAAAPEGAAKNKAATVAVPACGPDGTAEMILLPAFTEMVSQPKRFADSFVLRYKNTNPFTARALAEPTDAQLIIQNPPASPLTAEELDRVYSLPYTRAAHPMYDGSGGIPALKEVEFSLTVNRGCYGSCSFCSLAFHQGRIIQARSKESVIEEARQMIDNPGFKGIIHDVGGPTANFFHPACEKQQKEGGCADRECLFPEPCPNLNLDHRSYLNLLRDLRGLEGIKKVFIRSGIRFDYLMAAVESKKGNTGGEEFLSELCEYHVSGQLKTAPEHVSSKVLKQMKKPENPVYQRFVKAFEQKTQAIGKKQYIIPYLISGHPGSGLAEAVELAVYLKKQKFIPDQVQDFYPTPSSLSTCIYYTGIDPFTGEKVYTAKTPEEKAMQRALLHFHKPENRKLVLKALQKAGRTDLIGRGKNCLVR